MFYLHAFIWLTNLVIGQNIVFIQVTYSSILMAYVPSYEFPENYLSMPPGDSPRRSQTSSRKLAFAGDLDWFTCEIYHSLFHFVSFSYPSLALLFKGCKLFSERRLFISLWLRLKFNLLSYLLMDGISPVRCLFPSL